MNPSLDLDLSRMQTLLKWIVYDVAESNFASGFINIFVATLSISALISSDWVLIEDVTNSTAIEPFYDFPGAERCERLGTRDFWSISSFGGYVESNGKKHTAYRTEDRVLWDCVTPLVADLFYLLIALCFVVSLTALCGALLHVLAPPHGFLVWLRRNTIMEMCNMMLCLAACAVAIVAETTVAGLRPESSVSVGSGLFLLTLAGLLSFLSALMSLRHFSRIQRARRIDNQRLLCARSLRSWRDTGRRADDTRPIVDFERYLDSSTTTLEELDPIPKPIETI
ncbi:unnamed protein product, partial [Mesorhabditis belari]|uniref:Transmembrane protein 127 transmembrane region domain-containing protein n=1 Tax=Mesorhabditis belari TaxID=2138241 RepID=A0AAF3ESY8_9BILA